MMTWIDGFLNRITMYRLVLYYLAILLGVAFIFGFFGILPYDPAALALSTVIITAICWASNIIFARIFNAVTNVESIYITAFILVLIITPVSGSNYPGIVFLMFASAWAMASKYLLAIGKRHVFNPAAFGVALSAFTINQAATWWVAGNFPMMPFVVIGGLLIVRKIQRFDLIAAFLVTAFASVIATAGSSDVVTPVLQTILHSSIFFFAFVMLTEPLTTPPNRGLRMIYGAIVGIIFAPNIHIGSLYFTPELALLVGNTFSYIVSPKGRFMLTMTGVEEVAKDAYDFVFTPDRRFSFAPGQYMEWTLTHEYPDDRGNRRYFTLASSPLEDHVRLGVKFYHPSSTFKQALADMKPGDKISAAHLSGGFVLPKNPNKKLVFIAGGIGITPFRSMIQYLLDKKESRPITLFYANRMIEDVAYKEIFDQAAQELGMKTIYSITGAGSGAPQGARYAGAIDAALIRKEAPDYADCTFYISGPHAMVESFRKTLTDMGVSRWKIKSDFFPGFA